MKNTKITLLALLFLLLGLASGNATEPPSDSPCFVPAPQNFTAAYTAPDYVYLTWTPTASPDLCRIRTYRATDNQLISTVDVFGNIGFKLLFIPSNKSHYSVINVVCANGFESGYKATSNTFSAHRLDLLSIGYAPAPGNVECTISHGSQGCAISLTDISDFALRNANTEEVLKTFNVRQDPGNLHYQLLNGSANPAGGSNYSILLDLQNPDFYNGIEYSIRTAKGGEVKASFQVYTRYNPYGAELYVTSLADGLEIVKYEGDGLVSGGAVDTRNKSVSEASGKFQPTPNPFTNHLEVFPANPTAESIQLQLFNLSGQKVLDQQFAGGQEQYSLSTEGLANGFYFLRIEADGQVQTLKVIKSE